MERLYEGLFLLDSAEATKSWSDLEGHIRGLFSKHAAEVEYSERWADKKLAYPVRGVTKGTYFLAYFRAPTGKVNPLRRDAELSERILRLLITQEDWTEQEMNKRREAAAQRAHAEPAPAPSAEIPGAIPAGDDSAASAELGDASAPAWSETDELEEEPEEEERA